jgi:hypothetical protein
MKENGRIFFFFGLLCFIVLVCSGCGKKYPACNQPQKRPSNFDELEIKRGSTIVFTKHIKTGDEEKTILDNLSKFGITPIYGYQEKREKSFSIWKNEIKNKNLSKREAFDILQSKDALPIRADYEITYIVGGREPDYKLNIIVKEIHPESKTLTDWQYYEYGCATKRNYYSEIFPVACPIGSSENIKLCKPFAETEMIKILKRYIK